MSGIQIYTAIASFPNDWDLGVHAHEDAEVSVVLEGRGVLEAEGRRFSLEAGHVVLIPAELPHRYWAVSPIRFAILTVTGMPQELAKLFARLAPGEQSRVQLLSQLDLKQYDALFRLWLLTVSRPFAEKERYTCVWVELLLLFLLQHASADSRSVSLPISGAADYIRSNLHVPNLLISELAGIAGMSESVFRARFKGTYGVSPKEYHQQFRMAEAKWLLRSTDRPVQAIAGQVGFASQHAFSSWFQKREGHSPSEWKKLQQGKLQPASL